MDPAYKTALLLWVKDLVETAVLGALAWPVVRRVVKKYLAELTCPHCGKKFGKRGDDGKEETAAAVETQTETGRDIGLDQA